MEEHSPEWDNQSTFCLACMTKRGADGECKCPPPPSLEEFMKQMTAITNVEGDA